MLRNLLRVIFSHLRANQSTAQQIRDPSMQKSDNLKKPSLVSNSHGVSLPSQVLLTCRKPIFTVCDGAMSSGKLTLCCLFHYCSLFSSKKRFVSVNYFWYQQFPQVLTAHSRPRSSGSIKHRTLSFSQSNSVLRSMWMVHLGLSKISCAWVSQNRSNFHLF